MKWLAVAVVIVGLSSATQAQPDAESIIESASGESARLRELGALFQHPDPAVRYEAFRQLSASEHPLERNLAFQSALASTDVDLRSLAIIKRLEEMNPLVITASRGDAPVEAFVSRVLQDNQTAALSLPQISFDSLRGTFVVYHPNTPPSQVVGDTLHLVFQIAVLGYPVCAGTLQLVDGTGLAGPVDCSEGYGRFPVRIDLFH